MTPDPNNLLLGAGELFFDRVIAGVPTGFMRHLGNVDKFGTTATVTTVDKKSSMSGTRALLASVITGTDLEISLTMTEYDWDNLAMALLGTADIWTQSADSKSDVAVTDSLKFDVWYDLGSFNPTVSEVTVGSPPEAADPATYEIRAEAGMIRFPSSYTGAYALSEGDPVFWSGSVPAVEASAKRHVVQAIAGGKVQGHLRYVSAPDQAIGPRFCVDVWIVNLNPDGELPFIGEDFASFNLKGKVQQDVTKQTGEQYIRIVELPASA